MAFTVSKALEKKNHHCCPTVAEYRFLFNEQLPEQPERIRLGIELLAFTGCRISAAPYLSSSAEPGWLDVDGTKGGGGITAPGFFMPLQTLGTMWVTRSGLTQLMSPVSTSAT